MISFCDISLPTMAPAAPVMHRWSVAFAVPYGPPLVATVDAPTAIQALMEAMRLAKDGPNAGTVLYSSNIVITQLSTGFN